MQPPKFVSVPNKTRQEISGELWLGEGPDLLVLSPAHYGTAQYCALVSIGRLDESALVSESSDGGLLELIAAEHSPGVVVSAGSLATALGVSVGRAMARRLQKKAGDIWVFLSDGELQEGATWESLQLASAESLTNLKVIVDINNMQVDGPMKEIMPIEPIGDKFEAFGWQVFEVDGNDVDAITAACKKAQSSDKPAAVLCRTKPWTGFTFLKKRWDDKKLHFIRLTDAEREGLEKEIAAS
jgi:transketolase